MNSLVFSIKVKTLAILWRSTQVRWYWNRPRFMEVTFNLQLRCDCIDLLLDKSHPHVLTNFTEP